MSTLPACTGWAAGRSPWTRIVWRVVSPAVSEIGVRVLLACCRPERSGRWCLAALAQRDGQDRRARLLAQLALHGAAVTAGEHDPLHQAAMHTRPHLVRGDHHSQREQRAVERND